MCLMSQIRVVWEGPFYAGKDHSLAWVNRKVCERLLKKQNLEISLFPQYRDELEQAKAAGYKDPLAEHMQAKLSGPADIHICHLWPPPMNPPPEGKWVVYQPWEFGSIKREWLLNFRHRVDELWVPSKYNRDCYIKDGIAEERVKVTSEGVDPDIFFHGPKPANTKWTGKTKKKFKFLFVGGTIFRKGIDILLQAYLRSFKPTDDVCLVIKGVGASSFYSKGSATEQIHRIQSDPNAPEILYLDDHIPSSEMRDFYLECDCLVHPYRGEGFGLPVAEAMASGLPVILTRGGACDDFTNDDIVYYLKDVQKVPVDIGEATTREAWLLSPNTEELSQKMRLVFENREEAGQKGIKASEFIRSNFIWDKTAEIIAGRINALAGLKPVRHFHPVNSGVQPEDIFRKAEGLLKTENYEKASHLYLQLFNKYPQRYEASAGLGLVAWYQERYEEAQRWFSEALRLNPIDEDTLFNFCDVSLKLGQPQNAEFVLKRALSVKPTLSEVSRYLERLHQESLRGGGIRFEKFVAQREIIKKGEKLLREGIVDNAVKIFEMVLEQDPEDFEALCDMGIINYYLQNYDKAFEWFIKSLKIAPTVQDTLVNLFDTALRLKRVQEILPVLRHAVQMRPELSDISAILAKIEQKGEEIYSVENYDHIDPTEEIFKKGLSYLESGELNKATLSFLDAIDRKSYHDRAFNGLGMIAFYRGNYNDAYALFRHSVELSPLNADAVLNWYDAAKRLNRQLDVKPFLENLVEVEKLPSVVSALQEIESGID